MLTLALTVVACGLTVLTSAESWAQLDQKTLGTLYVLDISGQAKISELLVGGAIDPLPADQDREPQAVLVAAGMSAEDLNRTSCFSIITRRLFADVLDVIAAVKFTRQNNLSLAVMGGGHWAVSDP